MQTDFQNEAKDVTVDVKGTSTSFQAISPVSSMIIATLYDNGKDGDKANEGGYDISKGMTIGNIDGIAGMLKEGDIITVYPPEYRNDFLHSVDAIEDIMIGRNLKNFVPEMPSDFTKGKISDESQFGRQVKNIMVGLGYQEMTYCYLGSAKDFIQKMNITPEKVVQIANPMSENFEFVRPSVLPCLLNSESISSNAVYPHNIFEIGKIALINPEENYGVSTINALGFLSADKDTTFNTLNS